jgi:hypothetical protein
MCILSWCIFHLLLQEARARINVAAECPTFKSFGREIRKPSSMTSSRCRRQRISLTRCKLCSVRKPAVVVSDVVRSCVPGRRPTDGGKCCPLSNARTSPVSRLLTNWRKNVSWQPVILRSMTIAPFMHDGSLRSGDRCEHGFLSGSCTEHRSIIKY